MRSCLQRGGRPPSGRSGSMLLSYVPLAGHIPPPPPVSGEPLSTTPPVPPAPPLPALPPVPAEPPLPPVAPAAPPAPPVEPPAPPEPPAVVDASGVGITMVVLLLLLSLLHAYAASPDAAKRIPGTTAVPSFSNRMFMSLRLAVAVTANHVPTGA